VPELSGLDVISINVSDFVEKWEATYRRYGRSPSEAELIDDLPSYCSPPILKEDIQILDGYLSHNWDTLKTSLLYAFRSRDEKARTYTHPFLVHIFEIGMVDLTMHQISTFVLLYHVILQLLLILCGKSILDNYEVIHGFLQGLPRKWHSKLMSAKNIDYDNLQNVDFEDLRKWTLAKLGAKDNINFFDTRESTYAMANVRPEFGAQSTVSTMPSADFIASPPTQKLNSKLPTIVPDTTASGSSKASSGGQVSIDDLSKSLEALALKFAHLSDPQGRLPSSHDTRLNRQFSCFYCGISGHARNACNLLSSDRDRGIVYIDVSGRIALGTANSPRGLVPPG
jgi:hypothetical protein